MYETVSRTCKTIERQVALRVDEMIEELQASTEGEDPAHDFGHHILPRILGRASVRACR